MPEITLAWGEDPELAATLHLLGTPVIARRTAPFVDVERRSIRWDALLERAAAWSHGENLLVRAALDMWNGDAKTPLGELYLTLDEDNLRRVMEALAIRRRMPLPYRGRERGDG
jgi:hypothetical protein